MNYRFSTFCIALCFLITACSTSKTLNKTGFTPAEISTEALVSSLPNYKGELHTLSGKGRALVSEPGNSERVTIDFEANRELSLLTIRNRIGIEGGQMLVSRDSILIYDRINKKAQKVSIYQGRMTSLNELASINILDLINFKVDADEVANVFENESIFKLTLFSGAEVFISKKERTILQVLQPEGNAPYSKIEYEGYGEIEGFILPRRITILSSDKKSKVAFLIRSLQINPSDLALAIDLPEHVIIQRL